MEKVAVECPYEATYALIKGKWTICLLNQIASKPRGFNELLRLNPDMSPKMLALKLKTFEEKAVIKRRVLPTTPPSTEYSLDKLGEDLMPLLAAIESWGRNLLAGMAVEAVR